MFISKTKLLMAVLVMALVVPAAAYANDAWSDVENGKFYHDAVTWAKGNGMTTGCNGGTGFCPDRVVTRGENITFAKRYDDLNQVWLADIQADADAAQADADTNATNIGTNTAAAAAAQADADTNAADISDNTEFILSRKVGAVWTGILRPNTVTETVGVLGNDNFCGLTGMPDCTIEATWDIGNDKIKVTSTTLDLTGSCLSFQVTVMNPSTFEADGINLATVYKDTVNDELDILVYDETDMRVAETVSLAIHSHPCLIILGEGEGESPLPSEASDMPDSDG
jgi:hypothetical protein